MLDASVVLKWFAPTDERGRNEAQELRGEYGKGKLVVVVPSLLFLEVLNVAARRWEWDEPALMILARGLEDLLFQTAEPGLGSIATWTARGLTAYDAVYVALAEHRGSPLITDDRAILGIADEVARPLVPR